jgi:hypothetical protein
MISTRKGWVGLVLENTTNSKEEALAFINNHGIVTLFPIRGKSFPSLYAATKGNRKEKFDNAWRWADELAMGKLIHYGKLVQNQVTLVSLELFPFLYRLCRTSDLSSNAKRILGFLEKNGSASTTILRKSLGFLGSGKKVGFTKAIDESQRAFHIAVVEREKTSRMTYTYDLTERWILNALIEKAEKIDKEEARAKVVTKLMEIQTISKPADMEKLLYMSS